MAEPDKLIKEINAKYGSGTLTTAADARFRYDRIPTGILAIDWLLGGGFPRGRSNELYGYASTGKTTLAFKLIASAQQQGERCAYIDTESTLDADFAAHMGVDIEELVYHRQKHGNQVVDLVELLLYSGEYGVIVLDSIAALLPLQEFEKDMSAGSMGAEQAKMMSKALRKLTAANTNTVLLFVNQMRESMQIFAKRWTTPGGRALGFYASTRIELARNENIKKKRDVVDIQKGGTKKKDILRGHRVLVRIEKSKIGGVQNGDMSTFVFDYDFGGIDPIEDILYTGQVAGLIQKKGKRWKIGKKHEFGQKASAKRFLEDHPIVTEKLRERIRKRIETRLVEWEGGTQEEEQEERESGKKKS